MVYSKLSILNILYVDIPQVRKRNLIAEFGFIEICASLSFGSINSADLSCE